jgi:hypothetical protein
MTITTAGARSRQDSKRNWTTCRTQPHAQSSLHPPPPFSLTMACAAAAHCTHWGPPNRTGRLGHTPLLLLLLLLLPVLLLPPNPNHPGRCWALLLPPLLLPAGLVVLEGGGVLLAGGGLAGSGDGDDDDDTPGEHTRVTHGCDATRDRVEQHGGREGGGCQAPVEV